MLDIMDGEIGNMIELLMGVQKFTEPRITSGLLFGTDKEVGWYQSLYQPQGAQQILTTWPRTQNTTYYANAAEAPAGSVSNWYYDAARDAFVQPDNSSPMLSIISPVKLTQYTMETTLSSNNADDDMIGLVAAADLIDDEFHAIYVLIHAGGIGGSRFSIRFVDPTNIVYGQEIVGNNIIPTHANAGGGDGWSGKTIKVRMSRNGNMISAKCSTWNSTVLMDETELIVNINDLPRKGSRLNTPARYGFCTQSQAGSVYLGYTIQSSEIADGATMYSVESNGSWKYMGGVWNTQPITTTDSFKNFDRIVNNDTGDIFKNHNDVISFLRSDGIMEVNTPTTISAGKNITKNITAETINSLFTFESEVTVVGIFEPVGLQAVTSGTGIDITTTTTSGSFFVYLVSPDNINPITEINERHIRFVKIVVNVS